MRLNRKLELYQVTKDDSTGYSQDVETLLSRPFGSVELVSGLINVDKDNKKDRKRVSFTIRYRKLPDNLVIKFEGGSYSIDEIKDDFNKKYITLIGVLNNGS